MQIVLQDIIHLSCKCNLTSGTSENKATCNANVHTLTVN